jgi:hypothetical protein
VSLPDLLATKELLDGSHEVVNRYSLALGLLPSVFAAVEKSGVVAWT